MQTASSTLAAAAVAAERAPAQSLLVDWQNSGTYTGAENDQTAGLESLTIDRSITSDLPDVVTLLAGQASAELTAVTSGPTTIDGAAYFSPYNTASPLYGLRRRWRRLQASLGFVTSAGTELLTAFTGRTRSVVVDAATHAATITALDNAELMRGDASPPFFVATNVPAQRSYGLNGAWIIDYVARVCGFYASPPPRTNCRFLATMAGSTYPEVGSAIVAVGSTVGSSTFTSPAKWITAAAIGVSQTSTSFGATSSLQYQLTSGVSTNDGSEFIVEGWWRLDNLTFATNPGPGVGQLWQTTQYPELGNQTSVRVYVTSTGSLRCDIKRNGTASTVSTHISGFTVTTGSFHYVGVHVYMSGTLVRVHWRYDGSSATTDDTTIGSVTGQTSMNQIKVFDSNYPYNGAVEAVQVATTTSTTSAPSWNNAYTPSATIMPSLNALAAVPVTQSSAWDLIKQVAAAEFGMVGFDESGSFYFYNRNRWTTAPYTTSQLTISDDTALKAVSTEESVDPVRNHVRIVAQPVAVLPAAFVWSAQDAYTIPASGSLTVWMNLAQPAVEISTSWRYEPSGGTGQSAYRGNTQLDGKGTTVSNLTFATTVFAQSVKVVITNPNAFAVYLVNPSGVPSAQGTPSLSLWGTPVSFTTSAQLDSPSSSSASGSAQVQDVSDATSIGLYGEQLLALTGNPYLQNASSLATLASDLLAQLKDPKPVLRGIAIPADPRLQLGDRVTAISPTLGLSADFHIVRLRTTSDATGATQQIDVRAT